MVLKIKKYITQTLIDFISKKWTNLQHKNLVREVMGHGKNDYGDGGIFYAMFIPSKVKIVLLLLSMGY